MLAPVTEDDARLRAESAQIERLLEELREMVPPPAWQRIEQVLHRVVALYGAGLGHALAHAHAAGANDAFESRLCDDPLLASLLVLHGLHPQPTDVRVEHTVAALREHFGVSEAELALESIEDGVVRLRASPRLGGGSMSLRVAESAVRRAIEEAAPELERIELVGLPAAADPTLVQLRTRRAT
jgi:hypothetical protein